MKALLKVLGTLLGLLIAGIVAHIILFWGSYWSGASIMFTNLSTAFTDDSLYQPQAIVKGSQAGYVLPESAMENPGLDPDAINKTLATTERWPTAAILIWHDGELQVEHYGEEYSRDTRTESASMNKSVTALMVGAAIEDGFIESVDDPIGRYLSQWQNLPQGEIPIRSLLQMSSGLQIYSQFAPGTPMSALYFGNDALGPLENVELARDADTEFQYSGINSHALLLAVQQASGKPYNEYLSERLWQKIGAENAGLWLDREGGSPRGFCCLYANARSWLRLGLLHLNEGSVAGEQVISQSWMQDIATASPLNPNYGYQTWLGNKHEEKRFYNDITGPLTLHSEPFAADDLLYFDGAGGQRVYVSKKLGLVVVRTGGFAVDWDDAVLINTVINGIK